jgi:hypothetical protein
MWVLLVGEERPEERRGVRLRYGNAAPFDAKGRELSIDKPIPTVMGLNEMHNGHQFIIENDGEPVAPAPIAAKPPYRVPLMPEIAALPPNGLSIVSTFSGAGGSCLGFRLAGSGRSGRMSLSKRHARPMRRTTPAFRLTAARSAT